MEDKRGGRKKRNTVEPLGKIYKGALVKEVRRNKVERSGQSGSENLPLFSPHVQRPSQHQESIVRQQYLTPLAAAQQRQDVRTRGFKPDESRDAQILERTETFSDESRSHRFGRLARRQSFVRQEMEPDVRIDIPAESEENSSLRTREHSSPNRRPRRLRIFRSLLSKFDDVIPVRGRGPFFLFIICLVGGIYMPSKFGLSSLSGYIGVVLIICSLACLCLALCASDDDDDDDHALQISPEDPRQDRF